MNKEVFRKISKFVLIDIIFEIIYFPVWWYSYGLSSVFKFSIKSIKQNFRNYGISIGFRFLFKPMYSQNDFWGRIISFFMRLIVLIFKLIVFFVIFIFYIFIFILWIFLPIIILREIVVNYKFIK